MQKNKQELEILRHKVEHFQASGGGSGDSYTKAEIDEMLDDATTYAIEEAESNTESAIGDVFADDPIRFNHDSESDKDFFPTEKLDVLRLHKPFITTDRDTWYCLRYEQGYGWIYASFLSNYYHGLKYLLVLDETKEVIIDEGEAKTRSIDFSTLTLTNVTTASGDEISQDCYFDKNVSHIYLNLTATANISAGSTLVALSHEIPWDKFTSITAVDVNGNLIPIGTTLSNGVLLSSLKALTTISSGTTITIAASCITY